MKLKVGDKAPNFTRPATYNRTVQLSDYLGKNVVLVFFPLAWTPVWTNQIPNYEADIAKFEGLNTQVLGISVDHIPCLEAWTKELGGISYPLISDFWPHGQVAKKYGVFRDDGRSERAIFVIDKKGIIRYIDVHDIDDLPVNQIIFDVIMEMDPESGRHFMDLPDVGEMPTADVVMYCTSWCPDCEHARNWLKDHYIEFLEINVNEYPQAAAYVRSQANGNLVSPTFSIHGQAVVDFDKERLRKLLNIDE